MIWKLEDMQYLGPDLTKKLFLQFTSNFKEPAVQISNSQEEAFPALFYVLGFCATIIAVAIITLLGECKFAILETTRLFIQNLGDYVGYLARCMVY